MPLRRRHQPLWLIALLLVALTNATLAQGGVWRCDTGQACMSHGSDACRPPERRSSGCDGAQTPIGCAGPSSTEIGGVTATADAG